MAMRRKHLLEHTGVRVLAHRRAHCRGEICCLHNRTDHVLRAWPQHWRGDRGIMERICPCGIGHPDPDDKRIREGLDEGVHGCCGCHGVF